MNMSDHNKQDWTH